MKMLRRPALKASIETKGRVARPEERLSYFRQRFIAGRRRPGEEPVAGELLFRP